MKKLITNYTFDASDRKVTLTDYGTVVPEGLLLITNITDNVTIYQFNDPAKGGTFATNVVTLTYNTTSMSDMDDLQVFYDDAENLLTDTELRAAAVPVTDSPLLLELQAKTEPGDSQNVELSRALMVLAQSISDSPAMDKTVNGLRITVLGGTITTVTTVTTCATVTNLTNIDSVQGKVLTIAADMDAWANVVRARIA